MRTVADDLDLTLGCPDLIGVLETTAPVVAAARSVRIEPDAIARAAERLVGLSNGGKLVSAPAITTVLSMADRQWSGAMFLNACVTTF